MSMSTVCFLLKTARAVTLSYARSFSFLLFGLFSPWCSAETIYVDNHPIEVEVALTQAQQEKGLQGRERLNDNAGMLFVFNPSRIVCMWMKDVPIDLDVAFFDEKGQLVNIRHMKAQTQNTHCSIQPIRWALEVNDGWFDQKQISAGAQLSLKPKTKSP